MSEIAHDRRDSKIYALTDEQADQLSRLQALIDANEDIAGKMKQTLTVLQNRIDKTSASQNLFTPETEHVKNSLVGLADPHVENHLR